MSQGGSGAPKKGEQKRGYQRFMPANSGGSVLYGFPVRFRFPAVLLLAVALLASGNGWGIVIFPKADASASP